MWFPFVFVGFLRRLDTSGLICAMFSYAVLCCFELLWVVLCWSMLSSLCLLIVCTPPWYCLYHLSCCMWCYFALAGFVVFISFCCVLVCFFLVCYRLVCFRYVLFGFRLLYTMLFSGVLCCSSYVVLCWYMCF